MATVTKNKLLTFEDFCILVRDGQKADLLDGVIYMASPDNTDANEINGWLYALLLLFVQKQKLGKVYVSRVAFRLDDHNAPEPDIGFVSKDRTAAIRRGQVEGGPDLAVEIVSPDSVDRDYKQKREKYEKAGVSEYWILDEIKETVTWLHLDTKGTYRPIRPRKGILKSKTLSGFWLRPEWLWQQPLANLQDILDQILAGPQEG